MLTEIHPKLPMRDKAATKKFYEKLGFQNVGGDYDGYLMIKKDHIQIHFFEFLRILWSGIYPRKRNRKNLSVYARQQDYHAATRTFGDKAMGTERIFHHRPRSQFADIRRRSLNDRDLVQSQG
jgi:hypothetical protein